MRWRGAAVVALAMCPVLAGAACSQAIEQPKVVGDDAARVLSVNALQRLGNPAFHMRVGLTILDLAGKPEEQGQMEYWWAASGSHLDLKTPSVGTVHSFGLVGLKDDKARRSVFLAEQLAIALIDPALLAPVRNILLMPVADAGGATGLVCYHHPRQSAKKTPVAEVCVEPASGTIRTVQLVGEAISRNRTASFGATRVALDAEVSFARKPAISGHIDVLEGISRQKMPDFLMRNHMLEEADSVADNGARISATAPKYPDDALHEDLSGTFVVGFEVSAEGSVDAVVALSQGSPSMMGATINQVKQFRFKPMLFDGQPEPVRASVVTSFVINPE